MISMGEINHDKYNDSNRREIGVLSCTKIVANTVIAELSCLDMLIVSS